MVEFLAMQALSAIHSQTQTIFVFTGWVKVMLPGICIPGDSVLGPKDKLPTFTPCSDGVLVHVDTQLVSMPQPVCTDGCPDLYLVVMALLVPKGKQHTVQAAMAAWTLNTRARVWKRPIDRAINADTHAIEQALKVATRVETTSAATCITSYTPEQGSRTHLSPETNQQCVAVSTATLRTLATFLDKTQPTIAWTFTRPNHDTPLLQLSMPPRR